jgi:23S rRNA-/tRNA-specific pseudouridylate synthase
MSTVEAGTAEEAAAIIRNDAPVVQVLNVETAEVTDTAPVAAVLTSAEVKSRMEAQLAKLREKDATSLRLTKEVSGDYQCDSFQAFSPDYSIPQCLHLSRQDVRVAFEDDHILVVNKPSGVLTVSANNEFPSLAQTIGEAFGCELGNPARMVVHRLGMDTSGLIVLAKTPAAVRGMNAVFRNRMIERKYEALVCGVVEKESGLIDLPIMRDYEFPPYVRISTDEQQGKLDDLDAEIVGRKLLELPKESITKFEVIAREEFDGHPVTRLLLTSISGRYHQLNVHLAALGHPIVGDTTYGINGLAAPNGGLSPEQSKNLLPNPSRASLDLQQSIARAASAPCVHAKSLKFRHPVTQDEVSITCDAPW